MHSQFDDEDAISSDSDQSAVPSVKRSFTQFSAVRAKWSSVDFICFSLIYLISVSDYSTANYTNPNGPSFVQHIICMLLVGMPIQYMQVTLGQYTQMSAVYLKYMSPIGHGIGYSMILSTLLRILPTGVMAGDCLLYFLNCMQSKLPWYMCSENYKSICWDELNCKNESGPCITPTKFFPSYLYWNFTFMQEIPTTFEMSTPDIRRLVTIVCMWIAIFSILIHTTSIIKKVMRYIFYVCFGIINIIVIVLLLINTSAKRGFSYILYVSVDQLTNPNTWAASMVSVVETLSLGCGGFMLLGSHLAPESYSGLLTVMSLIVFNCADFIFTLTLHVAFAILAHASGLGDEGTGKVLANDFEFMEFTILPNSLLYTNVPQLWNFLYFASCVMFCYTTILINLRVVEITLADVHPNFIRYRKYILFGFLIFCLLSTLFFTTKGTFIYSGYNYTYSLNSFDLFLVFAFTTIVSWIYGVQRLCDDIHFIIGVQPTKYWKICWYFSPLLMGIFSLLQLRKLSMEGNPFTIFMFIVLITPLVVLMIRETFRYMKKRNLVGLFQPEELWGPPEQVVRHLRLIFNPRREIRSRRRNDTCQHKCLIGSKVLKRVIGEEEKFHMYYEEAQKVESTESVDMKELKS